MNILLFGISNIGKTTIGKILAKDLNYEFYDLDEVIKKVLGIATIEQFVNSGTLQLRDQIRCKQIKRLVDLPSNKVIAVTPMTFIKPLSSLFYKDDVLAIEITDSAVNIFDRLVFSDENDNVYHDDEYKMRHRSEYLREIGKDQSYYGNIFSILPNRINIAGCSAEKAAKKIAATYELTSS